MFVLLCLLFAGVAPFWETKAPEEWTDKELEQLLFASPWAQRLGTPMPESETPRVEVDPVHVFLATSRPMQMAEAECRRRARADTPPEQPEEDEFREFLAENPGAYIVLAVRPRRPRFLEDERELRRMEERSVLQIGRRKHRMVGHFPPTDQDP
ncbi:MAG: hypothetical protein GY953_56360, partial [bacterium]|nr:hypothetical protein [bacterium]